MPRSQFDRAVPGNRILAQIYAPAHAAADADQIAVEFLVPFDSRLKRVGILPTADVSGVETNHVTFNVINRGTDGAGTASLGTTALDVGVDLTGDAVNWVATGLTTDLTEDGVLTVTYEKEGTGLTVPKATWVFELDGG